MQEVHENLRSGQRRPNCFPAYRAVEYLFYSSYFFPTYMGKLLSLKTNQQ